MLKIYVKIWAYMLKIYNLHFKTQKTASGKDIQMEK